ncbi:MAG TPA: GrpB family protein [Steroidobacteraceae bacterium]
MHLPKKGGAHQTRDGSVSGGRRMAHLHVMTPDSARWHQQIVFRDKLRADPSLIADYAALKRVLATKHTADREAYSAAKSEFIRSVLRRPT